MSQLPTIPHDQFTWPPDTIVLPYWQTPEWCRYWLEEHRRTGHTLATRPLRNESESQLERYQAIAEMRDWASGVYLMPAFNRYDLAAEVVEACGA